MDLQREKKGGESVGGVTGVTPPSAAAPSHVSMFSFIFSGAGFTQRSENRAKIMCYRE